MNGEECRRQNVKYDSKTQPYKLSQFSDHDGPSLSMYAQLGTLETLAEPT